MFNKLMNTDIHLPFNTCKLNLRFYDKLTITQVKFSPVPLLGNFGTAALNNSYNRLEYVFE